jgi:hypothetical protein
MDIYGNHRVIRRHTTNGVMYVVVKDLTTNQVEHHEYQVAEV